MEGTQVNVGGDLSGIAVVGDNNFIRYYVGSPSALADEGEPPKVVLRERPDPRWRPMPAAGLVGREVELGIVRRWLREPAASVQVYGVPGVGKSALLSKIATDWQDAGEPVVYVQDASESVDDLLQRLFTIFYDNPDYQPTRERLRQFMGAVRALIVIDGFEGPAEHLAALISATPAATLLVGSTSRSMPSGGYALELRGLPEDAAAAFLTGQLAALQPGRPGAAPGPVPSETLSGIPNETQSEIPSGVPGGAPGEGLSGAPGGAPCGRVPGEGLSEQEHAAVHELCRLTGGHPRALLQAAVAMSRTGILAVATAPQTIADGLVAALDTRARSIWQVLTAMPGTWFSPAVVAVLAQAEHVDAAVAGLRGSALADVSAGGRLRAAGTPPVPVGAPAATGYAIQLTEWVKSARRDQIAENATAIVAVLRLALDRGTAEAACVLARTAAPFLGRSLRWGSWRQVLALGLEAATRAGRRDDLAYFEQEERTRKRALGLLLGVQAGAVGAGVLLNTSPAPGKGVSALGTAQGAVIATVTATVIISTAVLGMRMADAGPDARPQEISQVGAQPPVSHSRPPTSRSRPSVPPGQPFRPGSPPPAAPYNPPKHQVPPGPDRPTDRRSQQLPVDVGPVRLVISPSSPYVGDGGTARASGFAPREDVVFSWTSPSTGEGGRLGTAPATGRGVAELTDAIPGDLPAGAYTVTATGSTSGRSADARLDLRDKPARPLELTLSESAVTTGSQVQIRAIGSGFDEDEQVTFTLGGTALGTGTALRDGRAVLDFQIPAALTPGSHTVTATGAGGRRADARLRVEAANIVLTLPASNVTAGDTVRAIGSGFDEGEQVTFSRGGATLGASTALRDGRAVLDFQISAPGTHAITVTGRTPQRSDRKQLRVDPPPPRIGGDWGGYLRIRSLSSGYEGERYGPDFLEPRSGCTFPHGGIELRIAGQGPTYSGQVLWVKGDRAGTCEFAWTPATFTLNGRSDRLRICSTSPFNAANTKCDTYRRDPS
ncbi:Ig-like domain-containing protein [Nonomuraea typhae]|uniref:Ig-like domain-containing protein n=1 Tax=Nonomuraea typhae TaxID=2603600 RepID=UPI0012FA0A63|nr:NACHT domain-containing protein [Nonomuraea typhae]